MGFSFPQGSPAMPRTGGRAQLLLLEVLSFDGSSSFGRNGHVFLGFKHEGVFWGSKLTLT